MTVQQVKLHHREILCPSIIIMLDPFSYILQSGEATSGMYENGTNIT